MKKNEILEKQQAVAQANINRYNEFMDDIDQEIIRLNKKKNRYAQKISKHQIQYNQWENEKE